MTEIQQYEQPTAPAVTEPAPSLRARNLVQWADEARAASAIAQSLAKTSFVPAAFKNKPPEVAVAEITAAILTGNEMGLSPMASLRSFDLIQGVPAMRANAMRGVVQSHGHEVWIEKASPTKVVACGQRAGSDKVHRSEWTIERAQQLGLTSKDNWRKQPQAMLTARATSEVCRLTASDVLYGVPYSAEELADQDGAEAPKRKARRRALEPVPAPEPEFPEPERPAVEESPAEESAVGEPVADPWQDEPAAGAGESVWPPVAQPGGGAR